MASLIQVRAHAHRRAMVAPPEAPETFGAYEKKGAKSGGVMALMDMMVNDLKASAQEAGMAEKQAQKEYVELMKDSSDKRAQDNKSIVSDQGSKAQLDSDLASVKENQMLTLDQSQNV